MGYIANWLNEEMQHRQADMIVDETLWSLLSRKRLLDKYVPMKSYSSRNWLAYITKQINTMASVLAPGAELPTTKKGQFRRLQAEMFKVGLSHAYDEEDQWKMRDAMILAAARGISVQTEVVNGEPIEGTDNSLATLLFGNLQGLVRSISELLDYQMWQVLQYGAVDYTDPRTGGKASLDWKDSALTSNNHFPDPLTGNARWNQYSTANAIQDLYNALDTYIDTNGFAPKGIGMSRKLLNHALQQDSTKQAASSIFLNGGGTMVGTIGVDQFNTILDRRGLPPVELMDEHTEMDVTPGVNSAPLRFLNTNRYVFLTDNMGERAMGATIENEGNAGIFQRTYEKSKTPSIDVSEVVAMVMPVAPLISKLGFSQAVL